MSSFLAVLVAVLVTVLAGVASRIDPKPGPVARTLPHATCTAVDSGPGKPSFVVTSDLPLQGSSREETVEMTKAIRFELERAHYRAGRYAIGHQSCDDSTAQTGKWDSGRCAANARRYAANPSVIGVVGTFNSGCAEIEIPILNRAKPGPVAMISPANTYAGLTHADPPMTAPGEPGDLYPTGVRNYVRLLAADDYQAASNAMLAQQLGYRSVYVFEDGEAYGNGVATDFVRAGKRLGLQIAGFAAWDPRASSYEGLAAKVKASGADAVYLGGLECENGSKLVKDLRGLLGRDFPLIAPDGFSSFDDTFKNSGGVAVGMYISIAGLPDADAMGPAGKRWMADFRVALGDREPNPYSAYAAQAMDALLDAIARSDGSRAGVSAELRRTAEDGIVGHVAFDGNGDAVDNPVTQYRLDAHGDGVQFRVLTPAAYLVHR